MFVSTTEKKKVLLTFSKQLKVGDLLQPILLFQNVLSKKNDGAKVAL